MAKLKHTHITKVDIDQYINEFSDFRFEVLVLRELNMLGFDCEHAGTYDDPITNKTREFDIRARKCLIDKPSLKLHLAFSVECKNLKSNFPLVVHCMPRETDEGYLDLVWASKPKNYIVRYENATRIPVTGEASPYKANDPVGKSCDQIGRKASQEADLVSNDSDAFEKISQAINSAFDLINAAHYAAENEQDVVTIVVPVLVVPNDRIWSVLYKRTGEIFREPTLESNIEYYIDKSWLIGGAGNEYPKRYFMSHMEIVQISKLSEMVSKYTQLQLATSIGILLDTKLKHLQENRQS